MNLRLISTVLLVPIAVVAFAQTENRGFSVKDDIAMVRFSDPTEEQEDFNTNNIKYSPDGTRVAIVTTRGLLESDQTESTISVFDLGEVEKFVHDPSSRKPRPNVAAVITARPNGEQLAASSPTVKDLRWSSDSKTLYFRGLNSLGAMQLDEVTLNGGELRRLTPVDYSVDRFDVVEGTAAYTAARLNQPHPPQGEFINRDALAVTGYKIKDILIPGQIPSYYPETFVLGVVRPGDDTNQVHHVSSYSTADIRLLLSFFPFQLSPDGLQLVAATPVLEVPDAWERYDPPAAYAHFRLDGKDPTLTKPDNGLRPRQYTLIDLRTSKIMPLVNAPNARSLGYATDANAAAWAPDGSRVLVTNVFMPLDTQDSTSVPTKTPCVVASVDLPSLRVRCLFFRNGVSSLASARVHSVKFGRNADEALVSMRSDSTPDSVSTFVLSGDRWRFGSSRSVTDSGTGQNSGFTQHKHIEVFIKQSLNDPPTLWASDPNTQTEHEIWNPNPQLAKVQFGEASVYQWKDHSGTDWIGALVKPVGYIQGKRYPLVIQMYQFHEQEFLTDGTEPTAFAARHLASVGFVVLQIRKKLSTFSEADPQTSLEGYRSAIESLSEAGLIDPKKVGVVGFSWTCWYAVNALIKAPKLFAAATIADGLDSSYMQYILFGPGPANTHLQMDRIRGGNPFGSDQQRWFNEAPGFHLDQVKAPVRIEAINAASLLQEWELYSSLYMQHKPVDLIYFPEGTHVHQRPLERLESQQGNIDWLRFWLQGYEDPDPAKRTQYQRWEAMKHDSEPM